MVGRAELAQLGRWMAAVLACGPHAYLSHASAAGLWAIRVAAPDAPIHVSVPAAVDRRPPGITVHRRRGIPPEHVRLSSGIPVTSPALTLVDLATQVGRSSLEEAINQADKRDLIDPEALAQALTSLPRMPGIGALRRTLERRTATLTDSELERRFLPLARRAGLPPPLTQQWIDGFRVDFYWPDLGLVVETDGLRYHRTPAQQARDRLRDQVHTAAGRTPLRFTRAQVRFEPEHIVATLRAVASRLRGRAA